MNNINSYRAYFEAHLTVSYLENEADCVEQIKQAHNPFFTLTPVAYETFEAVSVQLNSVTFSYAIINVVQGIYHLASGILTLSKVRLYTGIRDFEEAYGRILQIVNKTKGAFYVQRALFHKASYELFMNAPFDKTAVKVDESVPHEHDAKRTSIQALLYNPDFYISKFKLEGVIKKAGGQAFLDDLKTLHCDLMQLSIYDFLSNPERLIRFFLIDDSKLLSITLEQIKSLDDKALETLKKRYDYFLRHNKGASLPIFSGEEDPNELIQNTPPLLYQFIPHDKLDRVDLTRLNVKQIEALVKIKNDLYEKLPIDLIRKSAFLLEKLSPAQINQLNDLTIEEFKAIFTSDNYIEKNCFAHLSLQALQSVLIHLDPKWLNAISDEKLAALDLSGLTSEKLEAVFRYQNKSRIQLLSIEKVQALLEKIKGVELSESQLRALDFSALSAQAIENIFYYLEDSEKKRIVQGLSIDQLFYAIPRMTSMLASFISDDQIKRLPFDKMDSKALDIIFNIRIDKEGRRFDLVKERMPDLLPKLEILEHVSDEIVKSFDISLLTVAQFKSLLWIKWDKKPRVHLIRDEQWKPFLKKDLVEYMPESAILEFIDCFDAEMLETLKMYRKSIFSKLGKAKLNTALKKYCFDLTDEQIPLVDFSMLDEKTSKEILSFIYYGVQNKGGLLTSEQLVCLASKGVERLELSKEQMEKIDFTKLSPIAIKSLLKWENYSIVSKKQIDDAIAIDIKSVELLAIYVQKKRLNLTDKEIRHYESILSILV